MLTLVYNVIGGFTLKKIVDNKKLVIKIVIPILVFLTFFLVLRNANAEIRFVTEEKQTLESSLKKTNTEVDGLKSTISDLEEKLDDSSKERDAISKKFNSYKKEMEPYENLAKEEAEAKAAELAKTREAEAKEKERVAAEKKAADEKAAQEKKAAEEKALAEEEARKQEEIARGYDTGITFDELARTPDDYVGNKIKFYGKVVQVMEGDTFTSLRFAADDNYDTVLYCEVPKDLVTNNRILEDDYVTLSGISYGLYTYKSTLGGNITIPAMTVDIIER